MNLQEVNNITMTEGTVRTIHDSNGKLLWGKLTYSTTYDGDTEQDGTPTPASPVDVDVVTGSQTVTISDGTNTGSFTVNLGTTELCKLSNYQDYIYKSGNDWYIHKEVGKSELGNLTWSPDSTNQTGIYRMSTNDLSGLFVPPSAISVAFTALSTHFVNVPANSSGTYGTNEGISANATGVAMQIYYSDYNTNTSETAFTTWLANNDVLLYYALATPTDTQITDATLIGQLNSIHQFLTRYGYTGIVSGNLPLVINQTTLS